MVRGIRNDSYLVLNRQNSSFISGGAKSLADDLVMVQGAVRGRVAFALRSIEAKPCY